MKILALDLSLTSSGFAIGDQVGTLPPPRTHDEGIPRIDWIMRRVLELAGVGKLPGIRPDLVVIEGYAMGSGKMSSHAHAKGELGGLVRWGLWTKGIPYVDIPPANLKLYATGLGNAAKEKVLAEAIRRLGYQGSSSDEADALWLQAMALDRYGRPVVEVPAKHREALRKVKWAEVRKEAA